MLQRGLRIYSATYSDKFRAPVSNIKIESGNLVLPAKVFWDTGSGLSVITKDVANILGLKSIGTCITDTLSGPMETNLYNVNLRLSKDILLKDIEVYETLSNLDEVSMLIGMNVISLGKFTIDNSGEQSILIFEV